MHCKYKYKSFLFKAWTGGRWNAGGEPFEGAGAVVGGIGAKVKEGEDASGGGAFEGAESEGETK